MPDGAEAAAPTIDAWFDEAGRAEDDERSFIQATAGVDSFFLDPEMVITEWPGIEGRVVEDPR